MHLVVEYSILEALKEDIKSNMSLKREEDHHSPNRRPSANIIKSNTDY